MKNYGLIGFPLTHSFSKKYFTEKFENLKLDDHAYHLYSLEHLSSFDKFLRSTHHLCGLNVTVPHKIGIMKYIDWLSVEAKAVGAVNCIRISAESPLLAAFSGEVGIKGHDFRLEGFNTDVYGFETSLKPLLRPQHTKAMILGNGGAARAVKYILDKLHIDYMIVTRKPGEDQTLFTDLEPRHFEECKLIINTTPIGTSPHVDQCPPILYDCLTPEHLLYDLIYNPDITMFLKNGLDRGAQAKNGYEMLVLQAEKSWEIWNTKALIA